MNEIIAINKSVIGGSEIPTVNAREIYFFLGVKRDFSNWIKKQIDRAGLLENRDFVKVAQKGELSSTGQNAIEYHLTLDAGKHIAMLSNTIKGRVVREYFIECEAKVKEIIPSQFHIPSTLSEALRLAADLSEKNETLEKQITFEKPLVDFAKAVEASENSVCVRDFSKVANSAGLNIGEFRLFSWMRDKKYLMANNEPYQRYINAGLFERVVKTYRRKNNAEPVSYNQTMITGKGQVVIMNNLKREYQPKTNTRQLRIAKDSK